MTHIFKLCPVWSHTASATGEPRYRTLSSFFNTLSVCMLSCFRTGTVIEPQLSIFLYNGCLGHAVSLHQ